MPSTASTVKIPTPEDKTSRITRYDRQKLSILRLSVVNSRQEYADMEHVQACDAKETQPHHRHSICGPPNLKTAVRAGECFMFSGVSYNSEVFCKQVDPQHVHACHVQESQARFLEACEDCLART